MSMSRGTTGLPAPGLAVASVIRSYNEVVLDCATRTLVQDAVNPDAERMEELRFPVERPDFKSGRGCQQSLVGSTPTLFRHPDFSPTQ